MGDSYEFELIILFNWSCEDLDTLRAEMTWEFENLDRMNGWSPAK